MKRHCNRSGKVIFRTELDAKIALAERVWKDKGERRYYPCQEHFHLTSQEKKAVGAGSLTERMAS
jgi:hypothetical protein